MPSPGEPWLSFANLVEVHVLDGIRREHEIAMPKVRKAIDYLAREFGSRHPLIERDLETDGLNLFIDKLGDLVAITEDGQVAMRDMLQAHLRRIDRDEAGVAARLYPFTRKRGPNEPRVIVMDPLVAFGRPSLVGRGVPTAVVASRYKAGESVEDLAGDYELERLDIEEAIRCELAIEAA